MTKRLVSVCSALVFLSVAGCSTVTVRVPVIHPAEINLHGKSELVIGTVTGPTASQVSALLKDRIVSSGHFKLIDHSHLNSVLAELQLSASDLANPDSRRRLGKLMTGSILLAGNVERSDYHENMTRYQATCVTKSVNGKGAKYACTSFQRTGKVSVAVNFDLIDIATSEDLKSKRVVCERTSTTNATDATPAAIDSRALLDSCMSQVVDTFMRAIAPWMGYAQVRFIKDSDLPPLEMGINYAKRGLWDDAIKEFKAAIEEADSQPDLDVDTAAKAYWDLGLAYEYTDVFDKAKENVKKAYEMTQDDSYLNEVSHIARREREQERLKEQTTGGETT